MNLLRILAVDTWLTYWHILLVTMFMGQLRNWIGGRWIGIAFGCLLIFVVASEYLAVQEDKDAVFMLGSIIRLTFASGALAAVVIGGVAVRSWIFRSSEG